MSAQDSSVPVERRKAVRAKTRRRALFETLLTGGVPGQGWVVDVSGAGFGLETRAPAARGELLHIEIAPRETGPSSAAIVARGRVARVAPVEGGCWLLGIRIVSETPRHPWSPELNGRPRKAVDGDLPARPYRRSHLTQPSETLKRRAPYRRWAALVFLLLLFMTAGVAAIDFFAFVAASSRMAFAAEIEKDSGAGGFAALGGAAPAAAGRISSNAEASMMRQATLAQRLPQREAGGKSFLPAWNAAPPGNILADRFNVGFTSSSTTSQFNVSDNSGAKGGIDQAVVVTVGDPRIDETAGAMGAVFVLLPLAADALSAEYPALYLEVNKKHFELAVVRDGEIWLRFPVGLGENDSTPDGVYLIANKIENPDWYDRGRTVKAGDPENPLGDYWMGLGASSRLTPYGIHGTNDGGSIGRAQSRGCIRMWPGDMERLFHLCEVGTLVRIEPVE